MNTFVQRLENFTDGCLPSSTQPDRTLVEKIDSLFINILFFLTIDFIVARRKSMLGNKTKLIKLEMHKVCKHKELKQQEAFLTIFPSGGLCLSLRGG